MNAFVLSQFLAGIAFAFGLASFQLKERRSVLVCLCISCLFSSSHFLLLSRPAPAALTIITAVRFLTAVFIVDRKVMYFFVFVSLCVFFATYQNALSYLALIATVLGTYASFLSIDRWMRILIMIGTSIWLVHNVLAGTPVAAIMEASLLTSNIIGYKRFYVDKEAELREKQG